MLIFNVIAKELKEVFRDKGFLLVIILEPLVSIIVFGYAFKGNINHLSTIVVNDDQSKYAQRIIQAINDYDVFNQIAFTGTLPQALESLKHNEARIIFHIPPAFGERIKNGDKADLNIYLDSSDYVLYNILVGASGLVVKESFKDIVELVVEDLESERDRKQQNVNEIQTLVKNLNAKTDKTLNGISDLSEQFDSTRSLLAETEDKVNTSNTAVTKVSSNISNIAADFGSLNTRLGDISSNVEGIKTSLQDLQTSNPTILPYLLPLQAKNEEATQRIWQIKNSLEPLNKEITELKSASNIKFTPEEFHLDKFRTILNNNETEVNNLNQTAHEIQASYQDIQSRTNDINLELKSLKKDFLSSPLQLNSKYVYGQISFFQYLTPAIISLALFFIGVMLPVLNIVNERNTGTFFRLLTTPLGKGTLLFGKFCVFFLVGVFETVYFLVLAIYGFHVQILGSWFHVTLVLLLLMAASIGLGLLISSLVKSMSQAVMIVPLIILPSIMISQIFAPVEVMPKIMQQVAYISPLFHANTALREIIIKGSDLQVVIPQMSMLALIAVSSFITGLLASKRHLS